MHVRVTGDRTHPLPRYLRYNAAGWGVILLIGISLLIHMWGIRQDLPYSPDVDEPIFVVAAARMAWSGDLNPHWFGNPGSTIIYPLAALIHVWDAAMNGGPWIGHDPLLEARFEHNPSPFFLLGRLLAIGYAVASVPLVFLIGRRAFSPTAGMVGAWLSLMAPVAIGYNQTVRTDSAATFFTLLSLWLCLLLTERISRGLLVGAGAAIGLAIASRYFMVMLIPAFALSCWVAVGPRPRRLWGAARACAIGLVAAGAAFVITTPYALLDYRLALNSIRNEARSTALSADGLSPLGNLWWYLSAALPDMSSLPLTVLALAAVGGALYRRDARQLILLSFMGPLLAAMSLSALHRDRWLIQLLPLLSLFAAAAIGALSSRLGHLGQAGARREGIRQISLVLAVALVSAQPLARIVQQNLAHTSPSTRVLARDWLLHNLPAGSALAQETYSAALSPEDFRSFVFQPHERLSPSLGPHKLRLLERYSLAHGHTLDDYRREGYRYLVINSWIAGNYLEEAARYPQETAFYQSLFATGRLIKQFTPSATRDGATISIYELDAPGGQSVP